MTSVSRPLASTASELRRAGLETAAHAAEEVELPEGIEAGVVELGAARRAGQGLFARHPRLGVAAAGRDRRREIEGHVATQGARLGDARQRDAHVVVRHQRHVDQLVERRVVEVLPEVRHALLRWSRWLRCRRTSARWASRAAGSWGPRRRRRARPRPTGLTRTETYAWEGTSASGAGRAAVSARRRRSST